MSIAAAVQEQQAAQGTKNVRDNINGVRTDADAATAAAANVKHASGRLETQSQQLDSPVKQFLGRIRDAVIRRWRQCRPTPAGFSRIARAAACA
jgi:hypothetical protein